MNQKLAKISKSFYFTVIIILLVSTSFSCNKKKCNTGDKKESQSNWNNKQQKGSKNGEKGYYKNRKGQQQ